MAMPELREGWRWALGLGQADVLGLLSLLAAVLLMLLNVLVSLQLSLRLHKTMIVATLRCVFQLTVLSYFLAPAFALNRWWLTLIYFVIVVLVSAAETVSRPTAAHEGLLIHVLLNLGSSSALVLAFSIPLVLRPSPWYNVNTVLPAVGLLLGNTVNGVSLGLSTAVKEFTEGHDQVELLLSIGASRREAMKGVMQRSLVTALTPALNQMSVVGLVSIPELMSGQLVAGISPLQAARFQIVIMLLSFTCATIASAVAVLCVSVVVLDGQHRLRSERLVGRPPERDAGVAQWVTAQTLKGYNSARKRWHQGTARIRIALGQRPGRQARGPGQGRWLLQSPIARRVLGRYQRDEAEESPSLDSRLRGFTHLTTDLDEQGSTVSGIFSDAEEGFATPNQSLLSSTDDSRRSFLLSPRRPGSHQDYGSQ